MTEQQSQSNLDIEKFLQKYNIKSTKRQIKSDFASGSINGTTFGLIFSYYFMPIDLNSPNATTKYRGSKLYYTLFNCLRFGFFFGATRIVFNGVERQQLPTNQALACKFGTLIVAMLFI